MIKTATFIFGLSVLLAAPFSYGQTPGDVAVNEAIYRQANRINLQQKIKAAKNAQERGEIANAAKLYDDCWDLVQKIGSGVDPETRAVQIGLAETRLNLAHHAQERGDLREADQQVKDVLRVEPSNAAALDFKRENDKLLVAHQGKMPSTEVLARVPDIAQEKVKANTLVQDGKLLYEMGKLDEAEAKLQKAINADPLNDAAYYYLNLIREQRYHEAQNRRDITSRMAMVDVETAWADSKKRDLLPQPNPYARTNLSFTSKGAQRIRRKLDQIHLDVVGPWDNLPLSEVVKFLSEQAKKRDPESAGINFIINPNSEAPAAAPGAGAIDPNTGLPTAAAPAEAVDVGATQIKLNPPLSDVRFSDLLDAIIKVADKRIKYSVEEYAVVFSVKTADQQPLYHRVIKVDPNTFEQGLANVVGFPFGALAQAVSSGGGGGAGGGGGLGGGGLAGGGVGGGAGGGGLGPLTIATVDVAGGGAGGGGGIGGGGGGSTGGGLIGITRTNNMSTVQTMVRTFFTDLGIDLTPPKAVFFNDREGSLLIYASLTDIDNIEEAVRVLNIAPPMVNIKSKFVEITQNDSRALGFDWYLGNTLINNGAIVGSGGTSPSLNGTPSTANPLGSFPLYGTIPTATTDGLLTSGLRNGINNIPPAPTVGTFTGILTDPQFRVAINALEQRDGVDLLDEASVTTLSGRQTQIHVVDLRTIVLGNSTTTSTGSATPSGGFGTIVANALPQINYSTSTLPFGPTLDVVPYVSADGFTVQLTLIPSITEFIGYDDPGAFVPQVGTSSGTSLAATLPLPHFRLRQVTTSAIVWDGQTVVLGGLITEDVTKMKDKVPVLGDIPLLGRLFRSESSATQKKNLLIFVTPTIIDPAGNRLHSEDEMPFAQGGIPAQKAVAPVAQ